MAGLTLTSFNDGLKVLYTKQRLRDMAYDRNPFLAMVAKFEGFVGLSMPIPIVYANPQGRSRSFTQAQTGSTASTTGISAFSLTRVHDYGICTIDNEAMEASEGSQGAFLAARKTEIDGTLKNVTRSLAIGMYREGYGARGTIAASGRSGSTITLANPKDVTNFEKGQVIVFAASVSSDALRGSGTSLTVSNVNRTAGTVTFSAALSGVASLADADVLFCVGDREDSASPARSMIAGLEAWCPATAPASTAFFGVDRSVDTRLGGLRQSSSGAPIQEALYDAAATAAQEGAKPDKCFVNYGNYAALEKSLSGQVQRVQLDVSAKIGFPGIRIEGPAGPIDVVADQNCPSSVAWMLEMDSWKLNSLKAAPRLIGSDGLDMIRQATADGVEVRTGYYANLSCDAPGYNIRVAI